MQQSIKRLKKALLYTAFCFAFFSILSCSNPSEAEVQKTAYDAMIAIHDEVMPMIGPINSLSRQLKKYEEVVDTADAAMLGKIDLAIRALEEADRGMMAWMNLIAGNNLEKLRADKNHEEIMAYIKQEEDNINVVGQKMTASIAQAEQLIEELENKLN